MNALTLPQAVQAKATPEVQRPCGAQAIIVIGAKPPIPLIPVMRASFNRGGAIHRQLTRFAATQTLTGKPAIDSVIIVIGGDRISHDVGHCVTPRIIFDACTFL
jgi:hypothetical protein